MRPRWTFVPLDARGLTIALGALVMSTGVLATTAGEERVKECVDDYSLAQSQSHAVTEKYCSCMDLKIGADEVKSVLEWEVSNAPDAAFCEKESGWGSRLSIGSE
jgi:hypothetical protein